MQLNAPFNPAQHKAHVPGGGGCTFPVGEHAAAITAHDIKPSQSTQGGTGYLEFTFANQDGSQTTPYRLSIHHSNPDVVTWAFEKLSGICAAVKWTRELVELSVLHNIPMTIVVAPQKSDPTRNEVVGVKPLEKLDQSKNAALYSASLAAIAAHTAATGGGGGYGGGQGGGNAGQGGWGHGQQTPPQDQQQGQQGAQGGGAAGGWGNNGAAGGQGGAGAHGGAGSQGGNGQAAGGQGGQGGGWGNQGNQGGGAGNGGNGGGFGGGQQTTPADGNGAGAGQAGGGNWGNNGGQQAQGNPAQNGGGWGQQK